jgi:hypothetical protein
MPKLPSNLLSTLFVFAVADGDWRRAHRRNGGRPPHSGQG